MSGKWQEAYKGLKDFIAAKPSIEIDETFTVVPGDVRNEFYRLFDDVRIAFLQEKFPAQLGEAEILSENYIKSEHEVTDLFKLEGIYTLPPLHKFLHDPRSELIRGLSDLLFDLLKGKESYESFEQKASRKIETTFEDGFRLGHAKWVALSLVKLLESDKLYNVPPPESKTTPHGEPVHLEKPVPFPEESIVLSFEHGPHLFPPFILPHFIVHSARLGRYVAVRTEVVYRAEYTALDASEKREWLSLDTIDEEYDLAAPSPSLLIYIGDKPEELALVADKHRICRPDLTVEYRESGDTVEAKLYEIINPKLGRYVVLKESVPEQMPQESMPASTPPQPLLEQGAEVQKEEQNKVVVHALAVGFELSRLEPIIEAMINSNNIDSGPPRLPVSGRMPRPAHVWPD